MKNLGKIVIASALALAFIALSQANTSVSENSFSVDQGGTLYIDTDSGSIEVESHELDTVEVMVRRKSDDLEVDVSQNGNDVKIKGTRKGFGFMSFGKSGAHFLIKVPRRYSTDLRTSGGSIELAAITGEVDAYTSGGSITLGKIVGDVKVKTSGGSISVDEVVGNVNAHTSGGSVKVRFAAQPTQDSRLTTSGGSITAYLESSVGINLDAKTSGGRVSSEFAVKGLIKRTKIKGEINGGGPQLTLKTSGGSVRVKKL